MSIKKISKQQPETFEFSEENLNIARNIISKYPEGKQQSAVMSLLYLVQNQNPKIAMLCISKIFIKVNLKRL